MVLLLRGASQSQMAAAAVHNWADLRANLDRLRTFMDRWQSSPPPAGTRRCGHAPVVELQDISYRYQTRDPGNSRQWALAGVDLRLDPGEQVGIIGPSGAGKSTLAAILLGVIAPEHGRVVIGGHELRDLAPGEWHRRVAWVPQEPRLLTGTVADNIRFLRPGISSDEVGRAARRAGLDPSRWPDGVMRAVGPGGIALSGGERQRVVLARALAGRPDLIVLDEPTSALDRETEEAVRRSLADLAGSVTLVIIAHRESLVSSCTRLIALNEGRVLESLIAARPS